MSKQNDSTEALINIVKIASIAIILFILARAIWQAAS